MSAETPISTKLISVFNEMYTKFTTELQQASKDAQDETLKDYVQQIAKLGSSYHETMIVYMQSMQKHEKSTK